MQRSKKWRVGTSVVSIILVVALLLTGTFAWQSISQQALNPIRVPGEPIHPEDGYAGGRLHDDFEYIANWANGTTANKNVYIENFETGPDARPIFVRIMMREFMAINGTPQYWAADPADHLTWPIRYPDFVRTAATPGSMAYASNQIAQWWNWTQDGAQKWFMPTFNRDPLSLSSDVKGAAVDPRSPEAFANPTARDDANWDALNNQPVGHNHGFPVQAGEFDFFERMQDAGPNGFHDGLHPYWWANMRYHNGTNAAITPAPVANTVQQTIAGAPVVNMDVWNGVPGNFWILDADGWAYWANPLQPGQATNLLLTAIQLTGSTTGEIDYRIHIDAQMSTARFWCDAFMHNGLTGVRSEMTQEAQDLLDLIAGPPCHGSGGVAPTPVPTPDPGTPGFAILTAAGQNDLEFIDVASIYFVAGYIGSPFTASPAADITWSVSPVMPALFFQTGSFNAHGQAMQARLGPTTAHMNVGDVFVVTATNNVTGSVATFNVPIVPVGGGFWNTPRATLTGIVSITPQPNRVIGAGSTLTPYMFDVVGTFSDGVNRHVTDPAIISGITFTPATLTPGSTAVQTIQAHVPGVATPFTFTVTPSTGTVVVPTPTPAPPTPSPEPGVPGLVGNVTVAVNPAATFDPGAALTPSMFTFTGNVHGLNRPLSATEVGQLGITFTPANVPNVPGTSQNVTVTVPNHGGNVTVSIPVAGTVIVPTPTPAPTPSPDPVGPQLIANPFDNLPQTVEDNRNGSQLVFGGEPALPGHIWVELTRNIFIGDVDMADPAIVWSHLGFFPMDRIVQGFVPGTPVTVHIQSASLGWFDLPHLARVPFAPTSIGSITVSTVEEHVTTGGQGPITIPAGSLRPWISPDVNSINSFLATRPGGYTAGVLAFDMMTSEYVVQFEIAGQRSADFTIRLDHQLSMPML